MDAAEPATAPAAADAAGDAPPPAAAAAPDAALQGGSAVRVARRPTRGAGAAGRAAAAAAGARDSGARDSGAHSGPPRANGLSNGAGGGGGGSSSDSESGADAAAATQPADAAAAAQSQAAAAAAAASAAPAAAAAAHPGVDVYDEAEPDPARCRALESSLWEVAALRAHYDPQVRATRAGEVEDQTQPNCWTGAGSLEACAGPRTSHVDAPHGRLCASTWRDEHGSTVAGDTAFDHSPVAGWLQWQQQRLPSA
jgi:CBF/Mak21 family